MSEIRRHELHRDVGNHSHTALRSSSAKIWYPYHPHFGKEVKVVRWFKKLGGNNVQVAFGDESQACLPDWMLDEQACEDIRPLENPCIAIEALRRLRRLLDAQPLLRRLQHGTGEDILHAPTEYVFNKSPIEHSGLGGRSSAVASAGSKPALRRSVEPDAPLLDQRRERKRGEGR